MVKKNAPDLSAPSSPGPGSFCVGDDITDTDCSLEAPRRPRSDAQVAAFEKSRAERAANRAAAAPAALATPAAPADPATPAAPVAAPASFRAEGACPAPAAKPRKARTDKGRKRCHLVRPGTTNAAQEDPEEEYYEPHRSGYTNFVIFL